MLPIALHLLAFVKLINFSFYNNRSESYFEFRILQTLLTLKEKNNNVSLRIKIFHTQAYFYK